MGLAVTDTLKIIATNLTTVASKDIFDFLKNYFIKEKVDIIIVGLAKKLNNTDSSSMQFIKPFTEKLKKTFPGLQIEMYDERYTSKLALQAMIESGASKKTRRNKALLDSISATILLQNYLEFLKFNKK